MTETSNASSKHDLFKKLLQSSLSDSRPELIPITDSTPSAKIHIVSPWR